MSAINRNGQVIHIGDAVSILGKVVSVSGIGSLAVVIVQSPLDAGTYNVQANDAAAVQQKVTVDNAPDSGHPAVSIRGKNYGAATDDITVLGAVTGIAGSGINAVLTVLLKSSQTSIVTAAGNCFSDQSASTVLP